MDIAVKVVKGAKKVKDVKDAKDVKDNANDDEIDKLKYHGVIQNDEIKKNLVDLFNRNTSEFIITIANNDVSVQHKNLKFKNKNFTTLKYCDDEEKKFINDL